MMDLMHTKREDLICFIRKQMEGPGGCNDNFSFDSDEWSTDEEILNTTPGSIYSTSVLFPQKKMVEDSEGVDKNTNEEYIQGTLQYNGNEEGDTLLEREDGNDRGENDIDEEDIYSLNRRFPNAIGISCCLDKDVDFAKDINITISGRYYTKIKGAERTKVQVVIKKEKDEFENFFKANESLSSFFTYKDGKITADDLTKQISNVKQLLKDINFKCAEQVSDSDDNLKRLFNDISDRNRFLLSYRDRLFSHLKKLPKSGELVLK